MNISVEAAGDAIICICIPKKNFEPGLTIELFGRRCLEEFQYV